MENEVSFCDVFSSELLSKTYNLFEAHINQDLIIKTFPELIRSNLLKGREWEKLQTVLLAYGMSLTKNEISEFLESNCYRVWFAKKHLDGHNFSDLEKSALAGYAFWKDNSVEGDKIDIFINEQRSFCSKDFVNTVFKCNIEGYVADYASFLALEHSKLN